jgi:splicing factor U2AF subunit
VQNIPQLTLNPHQSRQARRLYIGNIPRDSTDLEIAEFFNNAMFSGGISLNNNPTPIIAVQMNHEKNFAFIEFNNVEDANAGMSLDGITLRGHSLKVRRPKDYRPPAEDEKAPTTPPPGGSALPHIVSTNVAEGPNKIFIGGLPSYLNEEQVKELLTTFGALKSFNLVKDNNTGNSKGFAFFEYLEPEATDKACQGLNGMKIGEKTVLVQRASIGAKHPTPSADASSCLTNPTAINFLNLGMPIAAAAALLGLNINDPGPATRIVQCLNMVSLDDLLNDDEYDDILEDIREEAAKYGTVISITIPRPVKANPDQDFNANLPSKIKWGIGRVSDICLLLFRCSL